MKADRMSRSPIEAVRRKFGLCSTPDKSRYSGIARLGRKATPPMKPKTTRKPSKQLKKGKKIESVKSLRIHVRKAGENPLDY
jgi:hypothetical protein